MLPCLAAAVLLGSPRVSVDIVCWLPPSLLPTLPRASPPCFAAFVTILHSVNAVAEILTASKKTGERIPNRTPTKVSLAQLAIQARSQADIGHLTMGDPTAFYDCKDERWVLIWSSFSDSPSVTPSLFVAVSYTIDPLGKWRVYSLEARPTITVGYKFCEKGGSYFSPLAPQVRTASRGLLQKRHRGCASSMYVRSHQNMRVRSLTLSRSAGSN